MVSSVLFAWHNVGIRVQTVNPFSRLIRTQIQVRLLLERLFLPVGY